MGAMFTLVLSKLAAIVGWFSELFTAVFVALWNILTDLFCWVLEQLLKVVTAAVGVIDFAGMTTYAQGSTLPGELLNILGLLGVGTCIAIISSAIAIRLGLQLIPFVRLGS